MDDDTPDPNLDCSDPSDGDPHRLPAAVAKLRHPDGLTILEIAVRSELALNGEFVVAHSVASVNPSLVVGCASIPITGLPMELFAFLVTTGYLPGKDALSATDALARGLPSRLLSPGARRACELISAVEAEVERQRRERAGEEEDEHDA